MDPCEELPHNVYSPDYAIEYLLTLLYQAAITSIKNDRKENNLAFYSLAIVGNQ